MKKSIKYGGFRKMEIIKIKKNSQDQKVFHEKDINESVVVENPDVIAKKSIPQKMQDMEDMLKDMTMRINNLEETIRSIEDDIRSGFNKLSSTFQFYEITEQIQNLTIKFDNIIYYLKQNNMGTGFMKDKTAQEQGQNFEAHVVEEEPIPKTTENLNKKILARLVIQLKDKPYELDRNFIEILKSFLEKNPEDINTISPLVYDLLGKLDVDQEIVLESIRLLDYLRQKAKEKSQVH